MPQHSAPTPSRAAERLREYLDIINTNQKSRGRAIWYDIYRRAGNQYLTDQVICYLSDNNLIEGNKEEGYKLTKKGVEWHDILRKHSDLIGVLTRELSGDRRKNI